jgi:hypothetical protein
MMSILAVRQHRLRPGLNAFAIAVAACPLLALPLSAGLRLVGCVLVSGCQTSGSPARSASSMGSRT